MVYQLIHNNSSTGVRNHLEDIDGDFEKVSVADLTPDGGKKIRNSQFNAGRAILPEYVPTKLKPQRSRDFPQDDFMPAPNGASYVSAAFKALVEQFEPDTHQFFEMSVMNLEEKLGTVFFFIVANRIDALDHAACVPPIEPTDILYRRTGEPGAKRVFSKSQIGGAHIWSEKHELGIFMSDEFRDALFTQGLTGVKNSVRYDETN